MCKILMSINPKHVEKIINGHKKYEYRKKRARKKVDKIIVYSTFPAKKVVAEMLVEEVLSESPSKLWEITKNESGISKDFFNNYFDNCDVAYAYKIGEVVVFNQPKSLSDYGIQRAPQSFCYIK